MRPAPKPEILAPAGNPDMLRAAVFSGADAAYLGLPRLNARRTAGNFSAGDLCEAVSFCHARGVRVYVTLNTTIYPADLPDAARAVAEIARAGADGVIVQDLAAARLAKRIAPALPLHASTQMSVHSLDGARMLARLGFSRVILARELSLPEIAHIAANCGIETEVFVHGALCMSVSGQCWMSAFLGGRSGNRGACAGPCRLPFEARPGKYPPDGSRSPSASRQATTPERSPGGHGAPSAQAYHLSLKDLSALRLLPELARAGVVSAKIEGRLRTPEYVAAAVHAALLARAGEFYDENILRDVFSRSGFTNGYMEDRRGAAMFGVRTGEDAAAAHAAAPKLRELYRREYPGVGVSMALSLSPDGARLTVQDGESCCGQAESPGPLSPGQKPPAEAAAGYRRSLEKTGGTPFFVQETEVTGGEWYCPGGAVNELRRTALAELLAQRSMPRSLPHAAAEDALDALQAEIAQAAVPESPHSPRENGVGSGPAALEGQPNPKENETRTAQPAPDPRPHGCPPHVSHAGGRAGQAAPAPAHTAWAAHFEHVSAAPPDALADAAAVSFPLTEWREVPEELRGKAWLFAPRAVFGGAEETVRRLAHESAQAGFAGYVAQNIAQFETFRGLRAAGAFGLNVTNALAADAYRRMGACALTLSPELRAADLAWITAQTSLPLLALAYGHMPLMLTRACPLQNVRTCAECGGAGLLLDRKGKYFPVRCSGAGAQGARTIYNPVPLYWGDRPGALGNVTPLLYFTIEDAARARQVLARFAAHAPFDRPFTRGLYEKGTQELPSA